MGKHTQAFLTSTLDQGDWIASSIVTLPLQKQPLTTIGYESGWAWEKRKYTDSEMKPNQFIMNLIAVLSINWKKLNLPHDGTKTVLKHVGVVLDV
jgi:hypothetical protein